MSHENLRQLQALLEALDFSGRTAWRLEAYKQTTVSAFCLYDHRLIREDRLLYTLNFQKRRSGHYRLTGYDACLTRVDVPNVTVRGVNTLGLEQDLRQVEQYYELFSAVQGLEGLTKKTHDHIGRFIETTHATLERLAAWKKGEAPAKLLMFSYWPACRYRGYFADYSHLAVQYRVEQHFSARLANLPTTNQSYQHLKQALCSKKISNT